MTRLLKNGNLFLEGRFVPADVLITKGSVFVFERAGGAGLAPGIMDAPDAEEVIDIKGNDILPGFADVHVHFREPGFSYKETIRTGSMAAAAGGYTAVCPMPNVDPVPSTMEALEKQMEIIRRDALIPVIPYGSITRERSGRGELSDMEAMAPFVAGFSDDGCGIDEPGLMRDAMGLAKSLGKIIASHCEDKELVAPGGCVHDGELARKLGLTGISSASEWKQVERDVKLADETGCPYHVCHVSTKESVEIIRDAKKSGVDVTCETAPHYLVLTDSDLKDEGRFKMNPPVRSCLDRDALLEGVLDGTVDIIATDHAPHSEEEKSKGLEKSAFGIVGLETAFPVLYTKLVTGGIMPYERLIECLTSAPRKRFGLPGAEQLDGGSFKKVLSESAGATCEAAVGYEDAVNGLARIFCDMTVMDREKPFRIDPSSFRSLGRATPFRGWEVRGKVLMTVHDGEIVYRT